MLSKSSFQDNSQPPRNPRADSDAAVNSFDGTRMDRMKNVSTVAAAHTPTPTAESSYADGSFALGNATKTAGKASGKTISGSGTGFPGNAQSWG